MDSFDGLGNILLEEWWIIILVDDGFVVFYSLFDKRGIRYCNYVMVLEVYVDLE